MFSVYYGNGALMGFTPDQVRSASFWEFACAFAAWKRFNGVKSQGDGEVTIERLRELGLTDGGN